MPACVEKGSVGPVTVLSFWCWLGEVARPCARGVKGLESLFKRGEPVIEILP